MSFKDLIHRGDACRKAKDFKGAIELYQEVLAHAPQQERALFGLADAYRGANDIPRALNLLNQYVALKPDDVAAHARLGDAYKRMGHRDLAVEHYRKALALDARNRYALMGLGDLYIKEHRNAEALDCFEPLLEVDPSLVHILTMVGNIHRKQHAFDKAVACFRSALARTPHNPYVVFGMADSLRGLGQFLESAPFWDEIVEADPCNRQVLTRAGDCFWRLDALDKAGALFQRALDLGFDKAAAMGMAKVHRRRKAYDLAIPHLEELLAVHPGDIRAILLQGDILAEWKGSGEAIAFLRGQRAANPGLKELDGALSRLEDLV